jgi:hypothetical protein
VAPCFDLIESVARGISRIRDDVTKICCGCSGAANKQRGMVPTTMYFTHQWLLILLISVAPNWIRANSILDSNDWLPYSPISLHENESLVPAASSTSTAVPLKQRRQGRTKGRLAIELQGCEIHPLLSSDALLPISQQDSLSTSTLREVSMTLDPLSLIRLIKTGALLSNSFFIAFLGTLRLLAPLYVNMFFNNLQFLVYC